MKNQNPKLLLDPEFIEMVNHELKSPLSIIKISTEILQKQSDTLPEYNIKNSLEKINNKVDLLTQLINDYTDLVRIQLGDLEFDDQIYLLDQLILSLVEKHPYIIIKKPSKNPNILIDPIRFNQAVSSLLNYLPKISPPDSKINLFIKSNSSVINFYICNIDLNTDFNFESFYKDSNLWQLKKDLRISTGLTNLIVKRYKGEFKLYYLPKVGSIAILTFPIV